MLYATSIKEFKVSGMVQCVLTANTIL